MLSAFWKSAPVRHPQTERPEKVRIWFICFSKSNEVQFIIVQVSSSCISADPEKPSAAAQDRAVTCSPVPGQCPLATAEAGTFFSIS